MTVIITYFVHGTTTDNEAHISSGLNDVQLSELGVQQSKELAKTIADMHFDAVYCSDLVRAIESVKLMWDGNVEPIIDARLRECDYGDYNGQSSDVVEPLQEQSITTPMPGGESYEDVKERIADFLNEIKEKHTGQHIAIIGHKAPQLAFDVLLKGMTWEDAFANDWRKTKSWQPGWQYVIKS